MNPTLAAAAADGPGPFETDRQVRELPAVRAVYEAFDADPGVGHMAPHNELMLRESCAAAGVTLGAFDRRIVSWLAGWEPETCAVVAGLIARARHAAAYCPGQQAIVLSALEEAAGLIREQAAWCQECEMAPSAVCGDHEEALQRAEGYDQLAALLRGQP
jgi:hypothetical protein